MLYNKYNYRYHGLGHGFGVIYCFTFSATCVCGHFGSSHLPRPRVEFLFPTTRPFLWTTWFWGVLTVSSLAAISLPHFSVNTSLVGHVWFLGSCICPRPCTSRMFTLWALSPFPLLAAFSLSHFWVTTFTCGPFRISGKPLPLAALHRVISRLSLEVCTSNQL